MISFPPNTSRLLNKNLSKNFFLYSLVLLMLDRKMLFFISKLAYMHTYTHTHTVYSSNSKFLSWLVIYLEKVPNVLNAFYLIFFFLNVCLCFHQNHFSFRIWAATLDSDPLLWFLHFKFFPFFVCVCVRVFPSANYSNRYLSLLRNSTTYIIVCNLVMRIAFSAICVTNISTCDGHYLKRQRTKTK